MSKRSFADPVRVEDIHESQQTVKPRKDLDTRLLVVVAGVVGASVAVVFQTSVMILLMIGGKL